MSRDTPIRITRIQNWKAPLISASPTRYPANRRKSVDPLAPKASTACLIMSGWRACATSLRIRQKKPSAIPPR